MRGFSAHAGGAVIRVGNAKEGSALGARKVGGFGLNDAVCVAGVVFELFKINASNAVLYIKLILKSVGDGFGRADDHQVVGNALARSRIRGTGTAPEAFEKVVFRFAVLIAQVRTDEFPVEIWVVGRSLFLAQVKQRFERILDGVHRFLRQTGWENHAPAGLGQVGVVDAFANAEMRGFGLGFADLCIS